MSWDIVIFSTEQKLASVEEVDDDLTDIGEMVDLENPEKNGYGAFQDYLKHVMNQSR